MRDARRVLAALLLAAAAALIGQQSETVSVPEGAALRLLPEASSPSLTLIDEAVELPLLERRGDWVRVTYADWKGWVLLADGGQASGPAPLPQVDAKRLARATASLASPRRLALGPFHVVTDVRDEPLLARLGLVAAGLPAVYAQRYGLDPGVEADQHVVLFSREESYAAFELETTALRGYASKAHGGGVAVVVAGDRTPERVIELLVHELAHLLNRRALSPDPGGLPPWLEEGIAAELSYSRVSAGGRLEPGTLRNARTVRRNLRYFPPITVPLVTPDSPQKLANNLADLVWQREALPLAKLGLLPWAEFVRADTRKTAYAESANLVRYLLAGRRGAYADRFRGFLREVAEGMPAEIEALWSRLQVSPEAFEREFQAWLVAQRIPPRP